MPLALMLDILVAVLLVVTIGYAYLLNKRLAGLRRDKGELEKMALNFHTATDRAEESIARLKVNVEALQANMDKAESLRDDLVFLSERGGNAADRLEVAVRAARDEAGLSPAPAKPSAGDANKVETRDQAEASKISEDTIQSERGGLTADPAMRTGGDDGVSEAEKELLKALRSAG